MYKYIFLAFVITCKFSFAQKQDNFDKYITQVLQKDSVPGASLIIVKKGKTVKAGSYGFANLEHQVPAKQETVYELASVSKPITATAMMMLVQEGKIVLDSPIALYLGSVVTEPYQTITVRQLMNHTSGIVGDHYALTKLYAPTPLRYSAKEQLTDLFKMKPVAIPGKRYGYSNTGFFLLACIIENVTGMSYQQFIQTRIFDVAGMKHTYFINGDSIVANRVQIYTKRKGTLVRFSLEGTIQSLDANGFGGLMSTTGDLATFITAVTSGKLIQKESLQQMLTISKLSDGSDAGHQRNGSNIGLSWYVKEINGKRCVSHSGHTGTVLLFFPDEEITVVLLSNLSYGISMVGDKGYRVWDIGFELAEMALQQYGTKQ
jgi:D-alanyl-D-alanine carboxypeptidase